MYKIDDGAKSFIKKKQKINTKILTPKHYDNFNDEIIKQMKKLKK